MSHEELNTAQQEIARLKQELACAQAELEEFTYAVSHDLKASLRHVTSYAQIIKEDLGTQADKGIMSSLNTIAGAAKTMAQLIDGLTTLSRASRASVNAVSIDTSPLLIELKSELLASVPTRQIQWLIASDFPPVLADPVLLKQIWSNLLSNAIKFTRNQTVAQIEIGWTVSEPGLCSFHIQDNGVGYNPRYQDKLFKPLQRLHGQAEFEGVGLGLALTRKLVQRQGGTIQIQSDGTNGCEVRFTLPLL